MNNEKLRDVVDGLLLAKFAAYPNNVDVVVNQTVNEVSKIVLTELPESRPDCLVRPLVFDRVNHLFRQRRLEVRDSTDRCVSIVALPQRLRLVIDNTKRPT